MDIAEASPRFLRKIVELNLTAPMIFAAAAYRAMSEAGRGGCIINISSQASMPTGGATLVPYGAAKAGLNHMTRSLAIAWGKKVRVNCVSLGWVETEAMADLLLPANRSEWQATLDRIPVGRMGTPDEIGGICTFLASDAASYINGATIWTDGGGT
jgi:NAD(P)-dependent dehydrogenase (short-subunit alcohol dehydrogenase family)